MMLTNKKKEKKQRNACFLRPMHEMIKREKKMACVYQDMRTYIYIYIMNVHRTDVWF